MTFGTYRASPCVPSIAPDKTQEDPFTPTTTLRGLAALLSLGAAFSAQAANRQYPGPAAPCNTTLQACIDGADSGDTIILVTDSHIAEDVTIRKNLTLTPGQAQPSVRTITALATTADLDVVVIGLTSRGGASRARGFLAPGGGNLKLTVTGSELIGVGSNSAPELTASNAAGAYGRAQGVFEGNTLHQSGANGYCAPAIAVYAFQPGMSATVQGNDVNAYDLEACAAISFYGSAPSTPGTLALDAQVRKNIVQGRGFDEGILVRAYIGATRAAVINNLVAGQGSETGLRVLADGSNATVEARLLNNTVAGHQYGLRAGARTDLGSSVAGVLANNLFASNSSAGISFEGNLPGFTDHHNLVFGSPAPQPGDRPYGPGTRRGNPSFADAAGGDFRLRADSDAIDHGDDGVVDSPDGRDLDGQPRRVRTVDIGAYEFQGTPMPPAGSGIAPVPALGAGALAWAVALLALTRWTRLRRRR